LDRLCLVYEWLIEPLIQEMCWHGISENMGLEGRRQILGEDEQTACDRLSVAMDLAEATR